MTFDFFAWPQRMGMRPKKKLLFLEQMQRKD